MADQIIDIKFKISPDAKSITIEDDTAWDEELQSNITSTTLVITDNSDVPVIIANLTDNYADGAVTYPAIDSSNTLDDEWTGLTTEYLPDGIYKYELHYLGSGIDLSKLDGVFYSTKIIEGNINKDLLTFLTGVQAYNYKMDYPLLEEIRRRDNILFAINDAEFLSEENNVTNLLNLLKRLE